MYLTQKQKELLRSLINREINSLMQRVKIPKADKSAILDYQQKIMDYNNLIHELEEGWK